MTDTKIPTIESLSLLVDQLNTLLLESTDTIESLLNKNTNLKAENKQLNILLNQRNKQIITLSQFISSKKVVNELIGDTSNVKC